MRKKSKKNYKLWLACPVCKNEHRSNNSNKWGVCGFCLKGGKKSLGKKAPINRNNQTIIVGKKLKEMLGE